MSKQQQAQYPILAPAVSPPMSSSPQMPPVKRARLEPVSGANSPGPGTPISHPSAAFAASMSMPPPSSTSPIQKPVDTKDLTDVLFSTGVDLQAEEQYLYNDTPAASFAAPNASIPGGVSAEERAYNRSIAESSGKLRHSQDPFLSRNKLLQRTHETLIRERISSNADHNLLAEVLSIAVQERLREMLTTSTLYAQHRRRGNSVKGIGDWADIAFGEGEGRDGRLRTELPEGENVASPSGGISRKRSFAQANSSLTSPRTPALVSETAKSLRVLAMDERLIEEARITARQNRMNGKTGTPAADGGTGESMNPPPGSVAPEPEKRMTAKEAKKAQNSRLDEIQSHKAANETASLMLGGGRKKKYSWMSAGTGGGGGSGASTPNRMAGTPGATAGTPGAAAGPVASNAPPMYWGKRMGEWNEQGDRGKRIQIRDWVQALEQDGRETKSLQKAYLKLK
ncbi:hypothetical protein TWF281_011842 [Arthrobotrys megalospora]